MRLFDNIAQKAKKMKRLILIVGLVVIVTSCELFKSKEQRAIETCKKTKVQLDVSNIWGYAGLSMAGLTVNSTWLDYANMLAKQAPNAKLDWSASITDQQDIYLVAFTDEQGWGHSWEVDLEQEIVKHVNGNEYLSRKYGLSRLDVDGKFKIVDISVNTLKVERTKRRYSKAQSKDIVYIMKGRLVNNTDKILTTAKVEGKLQVIFKDKTLEGEQDWDFGFKRRVSKVNPWKPQEKLDFYIRTKGIEEIYLQYDPEYIFFNVNISAEDPIGFNYDKVVGEYNLIDKWKTLN